MRATSVIQIDLSAIDHNMRVIRRMVGPDVSICCIVKADAYGLGAARLIRRLETGGVGDAGGGGNGGGGAALLAVYSTEQAADLVRGAVTVPVLVLMPVWEMDRTDELYRAMVSGRLHVTVHGERHLEAVARIAERFGATVPVHLEIDTGLTRGGMGLDEAARVLRRVAGSRWLHLAGLFTHFASPTTDQPSTDRQMRQFSDFLSANEPCIPADCIIHAASTGAVIRHPRYHAGMVRIGLAWMGYAVETIESGEVLPEASELQPVVTWASRIVHLREVPVGASVGYGGRWRASRASRLALVPVGYADGYPTACGGRDGETPGMVAVLVATGPTLRRCWAPVVGAVSMDQITIDVTDLPEVGVGTTVELISPDPDAPNHLPTIARRAGLIAHDMLCRLNPRIRRVHVVRPPLIEPKPAALPGLTALHVEQAAESRESAQSVG